MFGVSGLTAWVVGVPLGFLPAVVIALLVTRSWRATVVAAGVFVVAACLWFFVGDWAWPWAVGMAVVGVAALRNDSSRGEGSGVSAARLR